MKRHFIPTVLRGFIGAAAWLWIVMPTMADEFSWNTVSGGSWGNAANWTKDAGSGPQDIPSVAGDIAKIRQNIAAATTINLDGDRTIGELQIGDTASGWFGYTIAAGSPAGSLFFDNGANNALLKKYGNALDTISANVTLSSTLEFSRPSGTANLTMSGVVDGAGGLVVSTGNLYLSNPNNSFTGNVTIESGAILRAYQHTSLGSNSSARSVYFKGGTLNYEGYTAAFTSALVLDFTQGNGTVRLQGASGTPRIAERLNGNGDFTKTGGATARISSAATNRDGANTFINEATLAIQHNNALGTNANVFITSSISPATFSFAFGATNFTWVFNRVDVGTADAGGTMDLTHEWSATPTRIWAISDLRMQNGLIRLGRNNVTEGTHTLRLNGNVTVNATTGTGSRIIDWGTAASGRIDLNGGTRTFDVAAGSPTSGIDLRVSVPIVDLAAGGGKLVKDGTGLMVLDGRSGSSTYSGGTEIAAGTLSVRNASGSATGTGPVWVQSAGTLSGNGIITGAVTVDGALVPGTSVGTLTVGDLTLNSGSVSLFEIEGTNAGEFDRVVSTGAVSFGGSLNLSFNAAYPLGTSWDLFDFNSYGGGTFTTITDLNGHHTPSELGFDPLTGTLSIIPEPTSVMLALSGLFLLKSIARRRKTS